jgi:phage anti-repressor protein
MRNTSQELIPIIKQGYDEQFVDARMLHEFLHSKQEFAHWIKSRIEDYGFIEGRDFLRNLSKSTGGRQATDYAITLDMAKELAMLERNEKGRQARQYFINAEKQLRSLQKQLLSGYDEVKTLLADVEKIEHEGFSWYAASQLRVLTGKSSGASYALHIHKLQLKNKAIKQERRGKDCWFVREDAITVFLNIKRSHMLATSVIRILNAGGVK